ncbi:MAG: PhoH family protein [Eubacteriales bacterium]|nr:PhoH family protein [Eubacteriales bacterium]
MQKTIFLDNPQEVSILLGALNAFANIVDQAFGVSSQASREGLVVEGDELAVSQAAAVWQGLVRSYRQDGQLSERTVQHFVSLASDSEESPNLLPGQDVLCVSAKGRPIRAKTQGQARYAKAMQEQDLVFAVGPAGTGKTFLAVAMAVRAFRNHEISRIILTRPAVEAGENLGFLPGDLQSKVDPYMRPLYDSLYDLMGADQFNRNLEKGSIEISPLAYMRGRTLDDAFIILDEAQNTSPEQMKMFLTRIGFHSRAVVTGDVTQIDLPREKRSGLLDMKRILASLSEVAFIELGKGDVVRNPLVKKIVAAYEADEARQQKSPYQQKWVKDHVR